MELTDTEKKIIQSYRSGAHIDIWFHGAKSYDEVMELMAPWKIQRIHELSENTINFKHGKDKLEVNGILKH